VNTTATGFFVQRNLFSTRAKILGFYIENEGLSSFLLFPAKNQTPLIPFVRYELEYKANQSANIIKRLEMVSLNTSWCANPQRLAIAFFVCEVIQQTCIQKNFDAQANAVLLATEQKLMHANNLFIIPLDFLCQWMEVLGYLPEAIDDANDFEVQEGVFSYHAHKKTAGATAWNRLLLKQDVADKEELREAFYLMLNYLNAQVPHFNVHQTVSILQQIFH